MLTFSFLALIASVQGGSHASRGAQPFPGSVLVVGPSGFTDIQAAIDVASDGDTIFVQQAGLFFYSGFTIQNKSLAVVEETGPQKLVEGAVFVKDLEPSKAVLIAGFKVTTYGSTAPSALIATDNAGSVRIEQCLLSGGALLQNDADVELVGCRLEGDAGDPSGYNTDGLAGGAGVSVDASNVALYGCLAFGGTGGGGGSGHADLPAGNGGSGGAGLQLSSGFAYASGSQFYGGDGGRGGDSGLCDDGGQPGNGGAGGSAIVVLGTAPSQPNVVTLGDSYSLGHGGQGGPDDSSTGLGGPCWHDGQAGADATVDIVAPPGSAVDLGGAARAFSAPRVAVQNTFATVSCTGQPGDFAQVFASSSPTFLYAQNLNGVVLTNPAQRVLLASGTIPAGGSLSFQIPLPSQGFAAKQWYLQGYLRDPSGRRFAASQVTLVELESEY